MSLHEEKAAALAEVLAATGEEIVWKGRTLHALVSDNPLSQDAGLGGFDAKGDCTMKVLRAALANRAATSGAINATGRLHIYGYAPLGTEPTAGDARFNTKLRYRFGFGPA